MAIRSLTRAKKAIEEGIFKEEIVPVTIKGRKGDTVVETDETPLKANLEKIPTLKPAFAKDGTVTMAAISELELDTEKVNVHGGACALGHPIGASGARIIVTLLAALKHHGQRRGLASLCIGGGEATALAVELIQ